MIRLPTVNARTMIRFLHDLGFKETRSKGSHFFFRHPDGRFVTMAVHKGEDLGRGITNKILHDAEVTRKEFIEWLYKN